MLAWLKGIAHSPQLMEPYTQAADATTLGALCEEPVSHHRQDSLSCVLVVLLFSGTRSCRLFRLSRLDHLLSILVGDVSHRGLQY